MDSVLTSMAFINVLNVALIDDDAFELTESFQVGLRFPGPPLPRVTLDQEQTEVEILDNDG